MATQPNLTPEQLMWLYQQQYQAPSSGSGWSQETAYGPMGGNVDHTAENGDTFHTTYNSSGSASDGNLAYNAGGIMGDVQAGKNKPGDMQNVYDTSGRYQTTAAIPEESFMDAWGPFLMALGPMAAMVAPGLGAAMSFGTNPVLGEAAAMGGGMGAAGAGGMVNGAFLGEGVASGIPAWDLAAANAAAGIAPAAGQNLFEGAAGAGGAAGGGAGAGSGLLGKLLGGASALTGGLAGAGKPSGGGGGGGDIDKKMDPRLDAYIYGDNGLFSRANGLLGQQMTPERSQGWRDMQTVGQGLLNQPIAGNGFNRFYPGK